MAVGQTERVLDDVRSERERQQSVEGWTPQHDDVHSVSEWVTLITQYLGRGIDAAMEAERYQEAGLSASYEAQVSMYRRRLVQVAALTIAAVESLDRLEVAHGG